MTCSGCAGRYAQNKGGMRTRHVYYPRPWCGECRLVKELKEPAVSREDLSLQGACRYEGTCKYPRRPFWSPSLAWMGIAGTANIVLGLMDEKVRIPWISRELENEWKLRLQSFKTKQPQDDGSTTSR